MCGTDEILKYVSTFHFTEGDIEYLRELMPHVEQAFFDYLLALDCSSIKLYMLPEGSVTFPRIPMIRVEGPLALAQLLETTFLTLVNYPSLVATNAARFRIAAGQDKELLEFGLRRAQGPDGGFSASKYCIVGGFDGTSNVSAGKHLGVKVKGTHGHAFVQAFTSMDEVLECHPNATVEHNGKFKGFKDKVLVKREEMGWGGTNDSELAAFAAYAISFPDIFLCLIDTYDTLTSGVR